MRRAATWNDAQRPENRTFIKRVAGPFLLIFIMFYLGFHAVSGERGVMALFKETRKLEIVNAELTEVRAKREAMERKVHLMSDSSLDLDLLDEQVRRVLGMANKNEIVYFDDNGETPKKK
jgi:cell division protein FtsB